MNQSTATLQCSWCGEGYVGKRTTRFCSDPCRADSARHRSRIKYREKVASSAGRAAERARDKKRYRKQRDALGIPARVIYPHCQHESGCDLSVYARHLCKRHYGQSRNSPRNPVMQAGCTEYLFGTGIPEAQRFSFRMLDGGRIIAYCSWCGHGLHCHSSEVRYCVTCGTTVVIDAKEASWVASKRLTQRRSKQAAA